MSNNEEVDKILREYADEPMESSNSNFNVQDILNEFGNDGSGNGGGRKGSSDNPNAFSPSQAGFNPSPLGEKRLSNADMRDEDLERILKEADKLYKPSEDLMTDGDYEKYLQGIENQGTPRMEDLSHLQRRRSESGITEENLPYKNVIEFVNYMETHYIRSKLESSENVFQLKKYKQHSKIKFTVLDFMKKQTLAGRFFRNNNMVTSIAAQEDIIFTGNNLGMIRMYSCEKELEFKSYSMKEIEQCDKRSVVCMEVSQDGDFLIAGYSNGYLALWDLHTTKCKKLITNVHKNCIVALKFIRNDKKKFQVISSDLDGQVFKVIITDGIFSVSHESQFLVSNNVPIFLISILKFEEEEKKFFPEFKNSLIVAFGSLESIMVIMLEPETKKMFKFDKPKYFKDNYVPDLSFGIGFVPNINDPEFIADSMMDMTGNQTFMQNQGNIDYNKPQVLLSISWGKVIYIYCLPTENGGVLPFTVSGHYINSHPIIRMGFLSSSIVFFFDKNKFVKVINTSLVTPGEVRLSQDSEQPIPMIDSNRKPELEEGRIVDAWDISFQTYLIDKNDNNTIKATYNNDIINLPKNIYVLAKKDFYHGRLLNWEQCLTNLQQKAEWMDALTLGLDIFHGRTSALADIPVDDFIRKTKVGHVLRNLVHEFAVINTGNDNVNMGLSNDRTFNERLSKCINICIEFCIEIDAVDFLLNSLQPLFDSKGYGDDFIQKLEPFIICDKIINQNLQENTISKIIQLYVKNKKYHVLSQILIHLDIVSIDIDYVKKVCNDHNLFTPMIYLYSNGKDEEYFYPINKMFEIFKNAKEIKPFTCYHDALKTMSTADLETSKQYIGHKLLWYINMCLNGKKIPSMANIQDTKYRKLVVRILVWLLSDEVLPKLLDFDSNALFLILSKVFQDDKIRSIMSHQEFDTYSEHKTKLTDLKPATVIEHITGECKKVNRPAILLDMYEFIAKISTIPDLNISKFLVIESGKYLLSNNHSREESHKSTTYNSNNFSKYIETMSNIIIDMIDSRTDLDKNDTFTLLTSSELSPFLMVKIHLLKQSKSYKRCLDVFLQAESHIKDKENKVFEWIDETFRELHDESPLDFEGLKDEVLNKLHVLADISIDNVTKLVENWFENEQDEVIHKLDKVENLQLKYVENVIEKFKDDDISAESEKKQEQYYNLLKLHVKLLCKLYPNQVLPNLQKRNSYPVEECLQECLDNKVIDAAIYLYQATGGIRDALNLSTNNLKECFRNILSNLTSSSFKDNTNSILLDDFKKNLNQSIEICENNSDKVEQSEAQEMWFQIIEILYDNLNKVKESLTESRRVYFEDLNKRLSQQIKDILEKMCSYVSIQAIITNVTDKYKEAEFKEFKKLLLKMLSSYSHLKNILISAKNLLANSVLYNVIELKKLNHKGNKYNLYKCDQCSKLFNHLSSEEIIYVFGCGHKCHVRCAANVEGELICVICRKNEIENSVTNPNIKSLIQPRVSAEGAQLMEGMDNNNDPSRKGRFDHYFSRLRAFDKHYLEKSSLLS